jgi:hypothetical protein
MNFRLRTLVLQLYIWISAEIGKGPGLKAQHFGINFRGLRPLLPPISQSTTVVLVWSVLFGLLAFWLARRFRRRRRIGIVLGLMVFSHWALDCITHPMALHLACRQPAGLRKCNRAYEGVRGGRGDGKPVACGQWRSVWGIQVGRGLYAVFFCEVRRGSLR